MSLHWEKELPGDGLCQGGSMSLYVIALLWCHKKGDIFDWFAENRWMFVFHAYIMQRLTKHVLQNIYPLIPFGKSNIWKKLPFYLWIIFHFSTFNIVLHRLRYCSLVFVEYCVKPLVESFFYPFTLRRLLSICQSGFRVNDFTYIVWFCQLWKARGWESWCWCARGKTHLGVLSILE